MKLEGVAREVQDVQKMVEFLVSHERHVEMKTAVAARRPERTERAKDEEEEPENEANLEHAMEELSKVVKMVVDR